MRVTYWTTACLEPAIEAVSKEVADLAGYFNDSGIFAISPHLNAQINIKDRVVGFHSDWDPFLRVGIALVERFTRINHIYAEVSPWHFFRVLGRRPIVLTIASEKGPAVPEFLRKCHRIVVQTPGMRQQVLRHGISPDKVRLIYPGVDLSRFGPRGARRPGARPRILMATFPRAEEELADRGILFLVDVASRCPDVDFVIVSRPWRGGSTALPKLLDLVNERRLRNLQVLEGVQSDMSQLYADVDFTVIPYTTAHGGKECPRSLVESLAAGVPVLVSCVAAISAFVEEHSCGKSHGLDADSFSAALDSAIGDYERLSGNAVRCARDYFDLRSTFSQYADIYDTLA